MLTAADVRALPKPNSSQWQAFEKHLVTVHSWYKHLPLLSGGEFIVFLTPDAGEDYPTQHPRLPIENTVEGYRLAFGHLDYMWRIPPRKAFERDGHSRSTVPSLDDELMKAGLFHLYPYISEEFYWSVHEEAVAGIRNGAQHSQAAEILNAYEADSQLEEAWENLTDAERDTVDSIHDKDDDREAVLQKSLLSASILDYLKLQDCYAKLHELELTKLKAVLSDFRHWLG
jgi:hypothetical protein